MNNATYRQAIYGKYITAGALHVPSSAEYKSYTAIVQKRLAGWLPPDLKVPCLDLGCGTGMLVYALLETGYACSLGIDSSEECVSVAQSNKLPVHLHDVTEFLTTGNGRFGLITAIDVIEHLTKAELITLLERVSARLLPGGTFILQTPNGESPFSGHYRYGDLTHELSFTRSSLSVLLSASGFQELEFREVAPIAHGPVSLVRSLCWQAARVAPQIWNLVELGHRGSGLLTRNIMVRARVR